MKTPRLLSLPAVLLLASCTGSMGSGPTTPAQAKSDNATFMSDLPAAARQTALFCQAQLQQKLGGTVYLISAPGIQSGDIDTNNQTTMISKGLLVVYDRIDKGMVTSAARRCVLQSENLIVHPSHAE